MGEVAAVVVAIVAVVTVVAVVVVAVGIQLHSRLFAPNLARKWRC